MSPPLRSMRPLPPSGGEPRELPMPRAKAWQMSGVPDEDGRLQDSPGGTASMPEPSLVFEGIDNTDGVAPPDTQGDVGHDHYVQWVNLSFGVFDRAGTKVYPPGSGWAAGNTLWQGFGGACETSNSGDPITVYDEVARRWVMGQFAISGPFYECIAVSVTSDPTGSWYRYAFETSDTLMNDYPKLGVWPDAYYMTANLFGGASEHGVGVWALERTQMLVGGPARMVYFDLATLPAPAPEVWSLLPADFEGAPPEVGAPNLMVNFFDDAWSVPGYTADSLVLWAFHVDWTNTASSTFSKVADIVVAPFDSALCSYNVNCVPQPGTGTKVAAISDRLMHRLQYRNLGVREVLVTNHTVNALEGQAGVRSYELEDPGTGWVVRNQNTYAPDTTHRFMGSAAMDAAGNMAVGYSVSSASVYPGARWAGRLADDPQDVMGQDETVLVAGGGSQTGSNRWGDYSAMQVDPVDGCTFFYTQMYYDTTSSFGWCTRVGAFTFPSCSNPPHGTIHGVVSNSVTLGPIAGATVQVGAYLTVTGSAGTYSVDVEAGTYDITVMAHGYSPATEAGVVVADGASLTKSYQLVEDPRADVDGFVRDDNTHMPLYARLTITAAGTTPAVIHTDPGTGYYNVRLYQGTDYTFSVEALLPGYASASAVVQPPPDGTTQSFGLLPSDCSAPGYAWSSVTGLAEAFDGALVPTAWQVVDLAGTGSVWRFDDPGGRGNQTGGAGGFAIADSDWSNPVPMDTALILPTLDLTGQATVLLSFRTDFNAFSGSEVGSVDISVAHGAWGTVWQKTGGDYRGPAAESVDLTALAAGQEDVRVRFRYLTAGWGAWWEVDDVVVGIAATPTCVWQGGGLVYGIVRDGNTREGLASATVSTDNGVTVTTETSPVLGPGFYLMYVPGPTLGPNTRTWTASRSGYTSQQYTGAVNIGSTQRLDFDLPAGKLTALPGSLTQRVDPGGTALQGFSLVNSGGVSAQFELEEFPRPAPLAPARGYPFVRIPWPAEEHPEELGPVKARSATAATLAPHAWGSGASIPGAARYRSAGVSCDGTVMYLFGGQTGSAIVDEALRYNPETDQWTNLAPLPLALTNFQAACVGNTIYLVGGYDGGAHTNSFLAYDVGTDTWSSGTWPNPRTPMVTSFQGKVYVCGGNPLSAETWVYDPATDGWAQLADMPHAATYGSFVTVGEHMFQIGGSLAQTWVQRYDPASNTWDDTGPQLGTGRMSPLSVQYGDLIHVISGGSGATWIGLDVVETYRPGDWPGGSWVTDTTPVPYPAVGMAGDCAADRIWGAGGMTGGSTVYGVNRFKDDGWICTAFWPSSIPWFSASPSAGLVPAHQEVSLSGTFDSSGLRPGLYRAQLRVETDTPYPKASLPLNLVVRFSDILDTSIFEGYIYGLAGAGVTLGCGYPGEHDYCPIAPLLRQELAAFVARARAGGDANVPSSGTVDGSPYNCTLGPDLFDDAAVGTTFCRHANYVAAHGIYSGCGSRLFCAFSDAPRWMTAQWLARGMLDGSQPPSDGTVETSPGIFEDYHCGSVGGSLFDDVAHDAEYCPHVHYLYSKHVTNGCGGSQGPNSRSFCPDDTVLREQMAKLLVLAFDIPYLR